MKFSPGSMTCMDARQLRYGFHRRNTMPAGLIEVEAIEA
jgi:hypothetical protein